VTVFAETVDPAGRRVVLDEASWLHIAAEHPEMQNYRNEVLMTISTPTHRSLDPRPGRERFWSRGRGPSRWLLAVVDFNAQPARVVTAFGNRKDPPGWTP
jgi:hypothetical protein